MIELDCARSLVEVRSDAHQPPAARELAAHKKEGDRFTIAGDLDIRGKAMPVTLEATFEGVGKDPWATG